MKDLNVYSFIFVQILLIHNPNHLIQVIDSLNIFTSLVSRIEVAYFWYRGFLRQVNESVSFTFLNCSLFLTYKLFSGSIFLRTYYHEILRNNYAGCYLYILQKLTIERHVKSLLKS